MIEGNALYGRCCKRPAIVTMDYTKATPTEAGPFALEPMVNRVCGTCYEHWFGPEGAVKRYTRSAWDVLMNAERVAS